MRFASVFFFSLGLYFQKKIGMSVIATIRDDIIAKIIVKPNCENNCPVSPFMYLEEIFGVHMQEGSGVDRDRGRASARPLGFSLCQASESLLFVKFLEHFLYWFVVGIDFKHLAEEEFGLLVVAQTHVV